MNATALAWPLAAGARVLVLENEDSFSWNVIDALPVERGAVLIRRGRDAARDAAALDDVGVVVIGPGPTDPVRAGIVDVVLAAARARVPVLGICLGHQAIGLAFGARLVRAVPTHGKRSAIAWRSSRLFPRFSGCETTVMRYHSLALDGVAPPLRTIAATADGVPMAIEHETLPVAGLQFHPDSYATPRGREMIADFFETAARFR